jgi:hypothetical protein
MWKYLKYLTMLPLLVNLIEDAETVYRGAKQGQVKKEHVINALNIMWSMVQGFGLFKELSFEQIAPEISQTIDAVVAWLNRFGVFKHA